MNLSTMKKFLLVSTLVVLPATALAQSQVCNNGAITIPDVGDAAPYPAAIAVAGQPSSITTVTVTLNGFSHTFMDDVGVVLVGPGGQAFNLADGITDGTDPVSNVTFTISDTGATPLPDDATLVAGTYQPADYYGDNYPAPGPGTAYSSPPTVGTATFASVYSGTNANGTWNLFIEDYVGGDDGSVSGGWCITFTGTPVSLQKFSVD